MLDLWKFRVWQLLLTALMIAGCSQVIETGEPGVLVSTDWLQDHLNDPDLVILHSGSADFYDSIHIQGARLIIPNAFIMNIEGVRNQMPPPDSIVDLLIEVGVDNDSKIVLYYESTATRNRTARVFVALDHLGLGDRTFILNGGLPAWQEEERELSDLLPEVSPGNLELTELKQVIIESAELDGQRWSDEIVLIDTRSNEEYYGTPASEEGPAEGGHIEGAYFLPYQDLLEENKPYLIKPEAEMEELFRKAGMDPGKKTVVYCGSGIRACVSYLAARHLGYPVLLYDGSYEEWRDLDLPLTRRVDLPNKIE